MTYEYMKMIGKGSYSDVYEVLSTNGDIYAAKVLDDDINLIETTIMKLGIKGIIELVEIFYDKERCKWVIIMPKLKYTLIERLKLPVPIETKRKMIRQLADIISELHLHGYSHSDIKPDNILVDEEDNLYLIDFSLTTRFSEMNPRRANSVNFRQIDLIYDKSKSMRGLITADSWAFGLVSLLIYTNHGKWSLLGIEDGEMDSYHKLLSDMRSTDDQYGYIVEMISRFQDLYSEDLEILKTIVSRNLALDPTKREWNMLSLSNIDLTNREISNFWEKPTFDTPFEKIKDVTYKSFEVSSSLNYSLKNITIGINIFIHILPKLEKEEDLDLINHCLGCIYLSVASSNDHLDEGSYLLAGKISVDEHTKILIKIVDLTSGRIDFPELIREGMDLDIALGAMIY